MTEPTPTTDELLAARYGARSPQHRRRMVAGVAAFALVALGLLGWIAWSQATPEVQGELKSYDVVSPHQVDVVIAIRRDSGDPVECTVSARAFDHSLVGEQTVTIPAGAGGAVDYPASISTEREATSVTVQNCH
jgi:hypothetical protein